MLEFELEVMLIGIGAETNLLDDNLGGIGLHLLGLFALLIEIFLIVQYLAHGRICLGTDFHQIKTESIRQSESLGDWIHPCFRDILSYETYLRSGNTLIYIKLIPVILLLTGIRSATLGARRFRSVRRCDN